MSIATLEQPVAQGRELCRLFVKKVPVPRIVTDADSLQAWRSWLRFVRKFAEMNLIGKIDRPCRVEATVRIYEGPSRRIDTGYATARWYCGIEDALIRSLVPADLLRDLDVKYEPIPPETPLVERPKLEGTEIVILEDDR